MKKIFNLLLVLSLTFFVFGCDQIESRSNINATIEAELVSANIERTDAIDIKVGIFKDHDKSLVLRYSDGKVENIEITEDMLVDDQKKFINEIGIHELCGFYKGKLFYFSIYVTPIRLRFYDYYTKELYDKGYTESNFREYLCNSSKEAKDCFEQFKIKYVNTYFNRVFSISDDYEFYDDTDIFMYENNYIHKVLFYDEKNQLISVQYVKHGESAVSPSDKVGLYPGCEFLGWDKDFSRVVSNLEVHAKYEINYFEVPSISFNGFYISWNHVEEPDNEITYLIYKDNIYLTETTEAYYHPSSVGTYYIVVMISGVLTSNPSNSIIISENDFEEIPSENNCLLDTNVLSHWEGLCKGKTVYVTEAGQDRESDTVAQLVIRCGGSPTTNTSLKASDVPVGSVVFLVVGASVKGLFSAETSKEKEAQRAGEFAARANAEEITLVVLHIGGTARRGTISDVIIDDAVAGANLVMVVDSGNYDDFFTTKCNNYQIPLYTFSSDYVMLESFRIFFR